MATAVDGSDFELSDSLSEQNLMHSPAHSSQLPEEDDGSSPPRSLRIYPRPQLLALSKSPLICVPPNMPELKEWFGSENEQNLSKKDSEPTTPNSGRERRFRRDAEENDLPSRPSFRSSLTQPSQMGNFKHQSLRAEADREGQERLRNLSEKFDRDRLGLPLSTLRTKERGVAPHLASASTRIAPQAQGTIAARRAETREATTKKKVGEAGEDWRRGGAETRRPDRNDRADREERERPRSRSRHRRDPSPTRREREGKEREKEREDYRRERVEKDRDDEEDPRRWRDDGRRDERTTARRDRERGGNSKDKESMSGNPSRWTVVEERDSRSKRNTGREKKTFSEETKVDERRGDREKEKEPAWMDTYVPTSSSGGILGAKGGEGELDGIQAWKKNMKEKEQKANKLAPSPESSKLLLKPAETEEPMDEIQRFKKMMEMAQKQSPDSPMVVGPILGSADSSKPSSTLDNDPVTVPRMSELTSTTSDTIASSKHDSDPSRSLLSLLNSNNDPTSHSPMNIDSGFPKLHSRLPLADNSIDRNNNDTTFNPPQGSRLLALGSRAPAKPTTNSQLLSSVVPNGGPTTTKPHLTGLSNIANPLSLMTDNSKVAPRTPSGFSPFEEQRELGDALRRPIGERTPYTNDPNGLWPDSSPLDPSTAGHAIGKGSRFAKFFDGKGKETIAQSIPKAPTPVGYVSSSPGPHVRPDSGFGQHMSNPNLEQPRTVDELFAKLNMNPIQGQRGVPGPNSTPMNHGPFGQQTQSQLHALQQQQQQQQQQLLQNQLHNARLEPLYESRNFMPDNMVPGLRSAPPPRNRENGGMFSADPLDDALLLNAQQQQRLPVQQRVVEQMYGGSIPAAYAQQQVARNAAGIPVQLPHFRGGPSPVSAQQSLLHGVQQQRLPPGLANLGARPPHDPAQFGIPGSLHNGLHMNGPPQQQQQAYNNFHPATTGFAPQAPLRPPAHQLQANHHQLANLGHPGNLDARVSQHAQLLAMGGLGGGGGGGMRNVSGGGFNHQAATSLQNPMLAMRQQAQHQQQQQPIHPQMLPHHLLPHHLQQVPPGPSSQTNTQELIALLMGTHRD